MAAWSAAALLLLLPLLAMQVTEEVNWAGSDFAIFAVMMVSAGVAVELTVRMTGNRAYRAAAGLAIATAFILVWANGAVGLIGDENNPANLMYAGVVGVGVVGALVSRFRPPGMARTMVATAGAQAAVAAVALMAGLAPSAAGLPWGVLIPTGFFAALWLASAWLFRRSGRELLTPPAGNGAPGF